MCNVCLIGTKNELNVYSFKFITITSNVFSIQNGIVLYHKKNCFDFKVLKNS